MEVVYRQHGADTGLKRRWGPLFLLAMDGYSRLPVSDPVRRVMLRVALTILYGATLWLLARTMSTRFRQLALIGLGLQSTPAIYAISNGMGEIVTAFVVAGHFYLFMGRRYVAAALLIVAGVYFKLHPVIFLFPYFVFSMFARAHRRYCVGVLAGSAALAAISFFVSGWRYGFFYPVSMIGSVVSDAELIPILSREVFGPMSVVGRVASGFRVHPVDAASLALARTIAPIFTTLLIVSTAVAALGFAAWERKRNHDDGEWRRALTIFQSAIGFLMFAFSLDVSITLLLPLLVSLYSPLWLRLLPSVLALFAAGSTLVGNLVPLSLLLKMLPFAWLDRAAGNATAVLIPHEKYLWYEVPMVGVALLFVSFCLAIRRDNRLRRNPGR
jgi:hypothetical protein